MSRIAGFLANLNEADRYRLLEQMLAVCRADATWQVQQDHAGPAALGLTGRQELTIARHEHVLVVLDSFVYNRDDFREPGNDAEFVAQRYLRHGFAETLAELNSDFAVALYDSRTGTLWLGRDRFGVRPLYYTAAHDCFAFASRPRALLALPGVSREVNRRFVALFAASHYRYFDNDPAESPYVAIRQLAAAHWLRFHGGQVATGTYWSLQDQPDFTEGEEELAARYRELLLDAVGRRLRVARRPAFTLSGGMDSSSVLAAAVHTSSNKQHAFSSVYADRTFDESEDIRTILPRTVKEWHPVAVDRPQVFDLVRRMVEAHDEPVATATWLSHFVVCEEAARQGFESFFGGLGGDELNAGEYEHFFYHFADLRRSGDEERLRRDVQMWAHYHDHPIYRKSLAVAEEGLSRLVDLRHPGRCRADRKRLERYASALNPDYFELRAFEPVMEHPFRSYLKNRTYQDMTRETIPCCLRAEDRQTAAFGLDHFLPFFDHRLVEFMFRVPSTLRYRDGVTKYLLRQAMRGVLPEETRNRVKKTGWNAPAHLWFSGRGREPLLDLLGSRAFRERGIYNVGEVYRLVDEHEEIVSRAEPREHHMMFFWQLANLDFWLRSVESLRFTR